MSKRLAAVVQCVVFLLLSVVSATQYHDGDYIATAAKAQFDGLRTKWHDLLGRHCPRFGIDQLVVMPLQKSAQPWKEETEYKLMLSFDGERVLTTWLKIVGPKTTAPPVLVVTLTSVGSELKSVRTEMTTPSDAYLAVHAPLVEEYADRSSWPRHLLVEYKWEQYSDVDASSGLFLLFASSMLTFVLLVSGSLAKFGTKIEPAMYELVESVESAIGGAEEEDTQGPPASYAAPRRPPRPMPQAPKPSHHD